ncbi:N4-gp56 family major capsid protein [Photobacterium damselae]|uniref:N4-gp56 family major capsid protein n=1 Tax=Photobacterium damselae TaxID=38293 RepID=UPI000D66242C|nr:N4-gp56 family major capsid protein [Photobacterium damselae]AWK83831.1 N4-gp56 family major capsid protein [Photobacterium damselae]
MTTITPAQAKHLQEVALFTAANRNRSFVNMLTEEAPKQVIGDQKGNKQTSPHAPVVRVSDLKKQAGESVDMQIIHKLSKRPTMGDRKLEGRGENLEFSNFDLKINQGRHMVDAGGKMSQQRTSHGIRRAGRTLLGPYFNDLQDQIATIHLAGARGDYFDDDIIVPLVNHKEFGEILVNDIMPPTYDRHFFGGDATSFESIDSADIFNMEVVDNIGLYLEEMAHPLQPIRYQSDELAGDEPFYLLTVTPRQWSTWQKTSSYKDWQQLTAAAINRSRNFRHPIFAGECAMRGNILVRKYKGMPIRFNQGSVVNVSNNDSQATAKQVEAKTTIDRAMLIGGQALANAWGSTSSGNQFKYTEKKVDHDNGTEISIAWMNGLKKIRFPDKRGRVNDHGVIALDTAVNL